MLLSAILRDSLPALSWERFRCARWAAELSELLDSRYSGPGVQRVPPSPHARRGHPGGLLTRPSHEAALTQQASSEALP